MIDTEQRPPEALLGLFARARRRLRTVWIAATSSAYAPWVCLAAVAVAAIGWVRPWTWPETVAIAVVVVSVVLLVIGALILRLPDPAVARAIDRGLETDDAIVTALQFSPEAPFGPRIHAQAGRFAEADLSEALPVPWRPRPLAIAAVLLGCLIALIVVSNPQDSVREQLAEEREQIEELADSFEEQAEEMLNAEDATAETEELAAELAALAEALRQADGLEDAIEQLDQSQEDLLRSLDADDLAERAATQGLERTLDANPLSSGDTASDQLASLAASLGELDEEQLAALAERLEQLAATQEAGDPETAEALAEAAEALAEGDLAAAQAALEAAGLSTAAAAASGEATGEVQAAAAAAGQAADALANGEGQGQGEGEGQGQGEGEGQGEGAGQGQGEGEGQGQGEGEGQGEGQGQGQGGGGQGMDATGNNPSGQGNAADVDGSGEQGDGIQAPPPDTPVLIPTDGESDTSNADVDVTGDGQTSTDQRVAGVTGSGVAQVPLESISNDFADRASEALDGTNISSSEAENVANYFDALTQE